MSFGDTLECHVLFEWPLRIIRIPFVRKSSFHNIVSLQNCLQNVWRRPDNDTINFALYETVCLPFYCMCERERERERGCEIDRKRERGKVREREKRDKERERVNPC